MNNSKLNSIILCLFNLFAFSQVPVLTDWRLIPVSISATPTNANIVSSLTSGSDFTGNYTIAGNSQATIDLRLPTLTKGGMLIYSVESDITNFTVDSYQSTDGISWTTLKIGNYHNGRPDDLQKVDIPQSLSGKYIRIVFNNTGTSSKNIKEIATYKFNSSGKNQYFVFIGASLTEPTGNHTTWKNAITAKLGSNLQPVIFNWSISGYNTQQILEKTDEFLSQHPNAGYVLFETAGNDVTAIRPMTYTRSIDGYHTSVYNNVKLIISKIKGYNLTPVMSRISYRNYGASTSWRGYTQPAVNAGLNQENGSLPYNFEIDNILKQEMPNYYNTSERRGYLDFYQLTLNNPQILSGDGTHILGTEQARVRDFWTDYAFKYIYTEQRAPVIPYTEIIPDLTNVATNAVTNAEITRNNDDIWNARILVEQIANTTTRLNLLTRLDPLIVSNTPPSISTQPSNVTVTEGALATFTIVANGSNPLNFQWQRNGTNISGANASTYTKSTILTDNGSSYRCIITNNFGSVTSNTVSLFVNSVLSTPTITSQPSNITTNEGTVVTFSTTATSNSPLNYQWQKNNENILGATAPNYSFTTILTDNNTNYKCIITNAAGIVVTNTVSLTVNAVTQNATGAILPRIWTYNSSKDPGFNTNQYESYTYRRTIGYSIQNLPFRLLKPINYPTDQPSYPLIIMFHGRGEAGTDNNFHLKWGGKEHLDAVNNKVFNGFVVYPQEPFGYWTTNPNFQNDGSQLSTALSQVYDLVDSLINKYKIDPNKVYVHGLSSGGTAVWASLYNHPELFAAALPMSTPGDATQIEKVSTTPFWLFQGGDDANPAPWISRPIMDGYRSMGATNLSSTKYSEYPGVGHASWTPAYNEPDFFPFMLRHDRKDLKVFGVNPIPVGGTVSLGVVSGMQMYEWYKDNTLIAGINNHRLNNVSVAGKYYVKFKRKVTDSQWQVSNTITIINSAITNPPPVVILNNPTNNVTFPGATSNIPMRAFASDANGTITKVEFFNGNTLLSTDATSPYEYTWYNVTTGKYTITAKATDNQGLTSTSSSTIYVGSINNTYPTVTIINPSYNSNYAPNSTINILANATDADGSIVKVDFFVNNIFLGSDNSSPYEILWPNIAAGTYNVMAKTYDNRGAISSSNNIVTISASGNNSPIVNLNSPITNSSFITPGSILMEASASDLDGTITKVEFYEGNNLLATDNTSPYSYSWTNMNPGTYNITARAFDNLNSVKNSTSSVVFVSNSNNQAPTVSIVSPTTSSIFTLPETIAINANAFDTDGTITKVNFYEGANLIGTVTTAPFVFVWNTQTPGIYTITAKATDDSNTETTSESVSVTLNPKPNVLPTVNITSPTNNSTYTSPVSITISANAVDEDGTISKVDFYQGTTLIGTVTAAPYSITWSNVAAGAYSLTAIATDNSNATVTSSAINIVVNAPTNVLPTVNLTSPANNSTFTAPAAVTITATAIDTDGSISKVDFYQGNVLIGTATTAPYSITWSNVTAGTYALTAIATDNANATTTSAVINITVNVLGNISPSVSITSPTNNASYIAPASVTINATATDADGSVTKVEFYQGTTLIGTVTAAPYTFTWSSVSAGTYVLTAKALDNSGAETASSSVTILVNNTSSNGPTVSITSPASQTVYAVGTNINIAASASKVGGSISKVEFYNGATLIGTDNYAPFTTTIWNSTSGLYTITAKATDNLGNATTSNPVYIEVNYANTSYFVNNISCVFSNQTTLFELNPDLVTNSTGFAWTYSGAGGTVTPLTNERHKANLVTQVALSGDLCVGVNYSVSPTYRKFCKTLSICPNGARESVTDYEAALETSVYFESAQNEFILNTSKDIASIKVFATNGTLMYTKENIPSNTVSNFGSNFTNGLYVIQINYTDGKNGSLKIIK